MPRLVEEDEGVISDAEVAKRSLRGELVKAPRFLDPPLDHNVMRELRAKVAAWVPHKPKGPNQ